jgi:hypothetical protein
LPAHSICFDVNFPEVWKSLADRGAELVVWPSAYSAGTSLQAHALNNHYYIVTATADRDCQVYDITGERIVIAKRDKLLKEHQGGIEMEKRCLANNGLCCTRRGRERVRALSLTNMDSRSCATTSTAVAAISMPCKETGGNRTLWIGIDSWAGQAHYRTRFPAMYTA